MVDTVTVVLADLLCSELRAFILFIYLFKEHPRRFKSHLPKIFRRKHLAVTFLRELDCCVFICKIFIPHYFLPAFLLYHSFSSCHPKKPCLKPLGQHPYPLPAVHQDQLWRPAWTAGVYLCTAMQLRHQLHPCPAFLPRCNGHQSCLVVCGWEGLQDTHWIKLAYLFFFPPYISPSHLPLWVCRRKKSTWAILWSAGRTMAPSIT